MKKITSFLAFLLLLCGTGCSSLSRTLTEPALFGTMWRPKQVPPYVYLEFTRDGRLVGAIESSRFFAPLKIDEEAGGLEIGSVAISRAKGGNPALEKSFLEMLKKVRFYRLEEHTLELFDQERKPVARLVSPFPRGKYPAEKEKK